MKLEIQEIVSAVGGRFLTEKPTAHVTGISTDTRTISAGSLFVPIKGESFDGHDYIKQAAENGAICALTERVSAPTDTDIPLIYVNSTRRALMDLADFYRRKHNVKVVAVAGSAGKTTTKDMIADILSQKFRVKRTIKNFNNDIGMPLSIFQLDDDDEVLVLEMGMNHAGEVHELSLVGAPDVAVITFIGDEHMENFASREDILHANLEIVDGLRTSGKVVLNGDDPLLTGEAAAEKLNGLNVLFPCEKNIDKAEPDGFNATRCVFNWNGKKINLTVPIPGGHMVKNALLATVVGLEMGVSPSRAKRAFDEFTPPAGRLNIFTAKGMTIIDDVYNANPASMVEAIKVLCLAKGRKIAILGDMNELGHIAEQRHRELGKYAASAGIDLLFTVGELSRFTHEESLSPKSSKAIHCNTICELLPILSEKLQAADTVLVKASRGAAFERIIQWIYQ